MKDPFCAASYVRSLSRWQYYTMFWISERGDNKFQVFSRGIQNGGDMY